MHRQIKKIPFKYYKLEGGYEKGSGFFYRRRKATNCFSYYNPSRNRWYMTGSKFTGGLLKTTREEVLKVFPALHI